jgi:hypothetical protein
VEPTKEGNITHKLSQKEKRNTKPSKLFQNNPEAVKYLKHIYQAINYKWF